MPWSTYVAAFLCVAGLTASFASPVAAHHSHANYDITRWTEMQGTVRQLVLMAPHSIVHLDVKDEKGGVVTWALEATNQRTILNNGVKREDVRPGDLIKVRCHVLRDGARGCLLGFVTPLHGDSARGHGVELEWD
jgi:hypothetical protein